MRRVVKLLIIAFIILLSLTIIITILSEMVISITDVKITYPLIAKIIHQTLEYMSWIGMPLILFSIADQHKSAISNFIKQQTEYWKNVKNISKSERDLVPFPMDIDTEAAPEEIIAQALETLESLVESSEYCISKIDIEVRNELHEDINLSIPNNTLHMEKYLRQLRVVIFEYKVQLDPNNKNKRSLKKYRNELQSFIESTSLID